MTAPKTLTLQERLAGLTFNEQGDIRLLGDSELYLEVRDFTDYLLSKGGYLFGKRTELVGQPKIKVNVSLPYQTKQGEVAGNTHNVPLKEGETVSITVTFDRPQQQKNYLRATVPLLFEPIRSLEAARRCVTLSNTILTYFDKHQAYRQQGTVRECAKDGALLERYLKEQSYSNLAQP